LELLDELRPLLHDHFRNLNDANALRELVQNDTLSIQLTPITIYKHVLRATLLGNFFSNLEEETCKPSDLVMAIYFGRYACAILPPNTNSTCMLSAKSLLAISLALYAKKRGSRIYCEEALALAQDVVLANISDRQFQSERLDHLGSIYRQRYELIRGPQYLNEAIRNAVQAIILSPDREQVFSQAQNLGLGLNIRYQLTRDPEDLANAIRCTEISLKSSSLSPRTKAERFNNLAIFMTHKWQISIANDDIANAIAF
jgi:hypothetical protein